MNGIDQHANCAWIALFCSIGTLIVWKLALEGLVGRVLQRWNIRVPKDMISFDDDLKRAAIASFEADLYAAQCRAGLIEMTGTLPKEFDPTVLFACQVSAGVHRAVMLQAEQEGLIRPGQFQRVYGASMERVYDGTFDRQSREEREDREDRESRESEAFDPFGSPVPRVLSASPASSLGSKRGNSEVVQLATRRKPDVPCDWRGGQLVPMKRSAGAVSNRSGRRS